MGYRTTKSKIKVESSKTNTYTEFYYHFFRNILLVGVPLVVIFAIVLSSIHSSATGSGSGTDSLTISISSACTLSSVVDSEHSTNTNVGTYTSDIGKTTIKTLCNDGNGYAIYANGYSDNEEGNNKLINSEYPQYSIDTGLATSGLTSTWAMKLNNIENDPSPTPPVIEQDYNNTYGIVPNYWTKVAGRTAGTTDMNEGSSFATTYSVYASSNQHAGTYQGQVKYLLTHPAYPPAFYFMQEVDTWKNLLAMEESVQAIDKRDGKSYWVTKLADGHIWMTQNLDLDLDTAKPLTSNDTDLTDHSLTGAYVDDYNYDANTGVITWTPESKTIDFQNTTVTDWANDNVNPYSANKTNSTETGHASLGNYYNWTAAIASNNSSSLTARSAKATNSICPKGWRLPAMSPNDFTRIRNLYNSPIGDPLYLMQSGRIISKSVLDSASGYYWSNTVYNLRDAYYMDISNGWGNTANVDGNTIRNWGLSIRCLAR